ncbi:MAG: hypothetical protein QXW71_04915 [Thermoplasmata archaeon]
MVEFKLSSEDLKQIRSFLKGRFDDFSKFLQLYAMIQYFDIDLHSLDNESKEVLIEFKRVIRSYLKSEARDERREFYDVVIKVKDLLTSNIFQRLEKGYSLETDEAKLIKKYLLLRTKFLKDIYFVENVDFDWRGRGYLVAVNILAIRRNYALIQVFFYKRFRVSNSFDSRVSFTTRRNNYLLIYEDVKRIHLHAISGQFLHSLFKTFDNEEVTEKKIKKWMFNLKNGNEKIIQQGDIVLQYLSNRKLKQKSIQRQTLFLNSSHLIDGYVERDGDYIYVYDTSFLIHRKNEHRSHKIESGVYRLRVAREVSEWSFSSKSVD